MGKLRGPKRPSLTVPQAAEYMGLTVRQLRRLIAKREITYWKTSGDPERGKGHVMFDPDALDQYIDEQTVEADG